MNRDNIILTIRNMCDIEKLNNSIKYINIDIVNIDKEVLEYLKINGKDYLYTDSINNRNGYIYVDYDTFFNGERLISNIINNIPSNLTKLEIAKYLYIKIGKLIGYDINSIPEKNEKFNFQDLSIINNIWGSITNYKATNQSYCKIYLYLCSRIGINCDIVTVDNRGYLCNKINIDNNNLIVDLTKDIPFIQASFKTRFFASYNDDKEVDNNINYINNENKIDKVLKKIEYNDNFIKDFLSKTEKIIDIDNLKPIELGIIYDLLFHKYCPDFNIRINNLYINDNNARKHFILISYNNEHYSYNYNKDTFMEITEKELISNIENENIGIYLNEKLFIDKCREL